MTEKDGSVMAAGGDKVGTGVPEEVDEITILDYVLLDFAEGSVAPRKNPPWEIETESWSHDG